MPRFLAKLGDDGHDNNLTGALLRAPNGALTHWRTAHPNGDSAVWREDHPQGLELLRRFRGGPYIVDQENYLNYYTLLQPVYRCEYEGFTGVVYQVTYHLPRTGVAAVRGFTAFSIDTPRSLPRTAVRPVGLLDSAFPGRGYQGIKTDDKNFDKTFHVQCEDEEFAKALFHEDFEQYLFHSWLARVASFVIDGNTLNTWNHYAVHTENDERWAFDYMSMMIDFLVGIWRAIPPQLRG
jgi:hypothetical protein